MHCCSFPVSCHVIINLPLGPLRNLNWRAGHPVKSFSSLFHFFYAPQRQALLFILYSFKLTFKSCHPRQRKQCTGAGFQSIPKLYTSMLAQSTFLFITFYPPLSTSLPYLSPVTPPCQALTPWLLFLPTQDVFSCLAPETVKMCCAAN